MSTSRLLNIGVGISLAVFALILGNILFFGRTNVISGISLPIFRLLYILFIMVVLGIVYLLNRDLLHTPIEHVLILASILFISIGAAALAGNLKGVHDVNNFLVGHAYSVDLQTQNQYYAEYTQSLIDFEKVIISNNRMLEQKVTDLTDKINNRTPVIEEQIVTLPPEVIYVDEPAPTINYPRQYEREIEDD